MSHYICGPMSGVRDHNFPAFRDAAKQLRKQGYKIVSPVELDEEDGFDEKSDNVDQGTPQWARFLARDVEVVCRESVEGLIALAGWENSRGAALEVHVARELGKPILAYPDMEPVKEPTKYRPPTDETVLEEAERLVGGDRGEEYGHPADDFGRTAQIMSAILGIEVRAEQVPLLMVAVKLSRLVQSPQKRDSAADIAGYIRTYEMTLERQDNALR